MIVELKHFSWFLLKENQSQFGPEIPEWKYVQAIFIKVRQIIDYIESFGLFILQIEVYSTIDR